MEVLIKINTKRPNCDIIPTLQLLTIRINPCNVLYVNIPLVMAFHVSLFLLGDAAGNYHRSKNHVREEMGLSFE